MFLAGGCELRERGQMHYRDKKLSYDTIGGLWVGCISANLIDDTVGGVASQALPILVIMNRMK